jgi:hypothetical protein
MQSTPIARPKGRPLTGLSLISSNIDCSKMPKDPHPREVHRGQAPQSAPYEKGDGRYAAGFFLQLPARTPVPSHWTSDFSGLVSEWLTD